MGGGGSISIAVLAAHARHNHSKFVYMDGIYVVDGANSKQMGEQVYVHTYVVP